jgi:hypothetical protein
MYSLLVPFLIRDAIDCPPKTRSPLALDQEAVAAIGGRRRTQHAISTFDTRDVGSAPRVRGTGGRARTAARCAVQPRVCGEQVGVEEDVARLVRLNPACAGNRSPA